MPHRFFSPPPSLPSSPSSDSLSHQSIQDESLEDPFSAGSDGAGSNTDDEGTRQNTMNNSGNVQSSTGSLSAMPVNPFKKTLASLDTESKSDLTSLGSELGNEERSVEAESKILRPHYDVDDFKRLLLTGEKSVFGGNAAVPPPVSFQSSAQFGDSSSNTDASSISRQSIFEPVSGPLQESPRTSHESIPLDDEQHRLVGSTSTTSERDQPSTRRHRHGKLVKSNAPQTVSFEDPTLSLSESTRSAMAPGDVEKPLPPLPPPLNTQLLKQSSTESTNHDLRVGPKDDPSSNTAQKRSPPVPPLSRRHSQLRAKPFASSIERSTPITEEASTGSALLSQSLPTASAKAPPAPPPRRAGLVRGNSSSSVSLGPTPTKMSDKPNATDVSTRSAKPRPPVPPNRSPLISSVKKPNQTQSIPGSSSVAPPPPPRRRGSSQSSYTPSRLSGHYTERLRSDSGASSISHLAMTPAGPSSAESKDVMADLSALQREVDELRGKLKD